MKKLVCAQPGKFNYATGRKPVLEKGEVKPATYITHRVVFDEVADVFEDWLNPVNAVIKAIVEMEDNY
jgi:threonine dehydrogenase-like Zn-dependent dehydrogenase